MNAPAKKVDPLIKQLVYARNRGRADDLLLKRAEHAARTADPVDKFDILGMVAALRYDEDAAMVNFAKAVRLAPGAFRPAWNRAVTAMMFGRWDDALEMFSDVAERFDSPDARMCEFEMLRFRGRFDEAMALADRMELQTKDSSLADIFRKHGLKQSRIAELMDRAGEFLRERRLPALGAGMHAWDADEGIIEAIIYVPSQEYLDAEFVDFMSRFEPLPAEESTIIIGFEPFDVDSLAQAA